MSLIPAFVGIAYWAGFVGLADDHRCRRGHEGRASEE